MTTNCNNHVADHDPGIFCWAAVNRVIALHQHAIVAFEAIDTCIVGPNLTHRNAQYRNSYAPFLDQLICNLSDQRDRNRESVSREVSSLARNHAVEANCLTLHVDERPTRVPWINRCISLNEITDGHPTAT